MQVVTTNICLHTTAHSLVKTYIGTYILYTFCTYTLLSRSLSGSSTTRPYWAHLSTCYRSQILVHGFQNHHHILTAQKSSTGTFGSLGKVICVLYLSSFLLTFTFISCYCLCPYSNTETNTGYPSNTSGLISVQTAAQKFILTNSTVRYNVTSLQCTCTQQK